MEPLESDVFADGVCSDVEGEEFNSEACQWEEEEEEEKQEVTAKPPPVAAAIPEKVFFPQFIRMTFFNVLQVLHSYYA